MKRPALPALALAVPLLAGCVEDSAPVRIGEPCLEEGYLPGPYGSQPCDRIRNICFEPANEASRALAGEDGRLSLNDLIADESVRGVLLFGTAGWCQVCAQEADWLREIYEGLQDVDGEGGRIELVAAIFEDDYGDTADVVYAEGYARYKGIEFPAVADTFKELLGYFDASAAPGNVLISREGMTIAQVLQGFDLEALRRAIDALDGSSACQ